MATATASAAQPVPVAEAAYPRARWRLLSDEHLLRTPVWASHILIRHQEVATPSVSFSFGDWRSSSPLPQRSRDEARALATSLAHELQADPGRFSAAAALQSEDEATRTRGGSLGGRSALEYFTFGAMLDAMAALKPGEVSRAIETPYGFHVFQRQPPPKPELVSGAHLVIGYDDAGWLRNVVARGPVPARSREEAFAVARSLFERLRQTPDLFSTFVDQYSEHRDAAWGGDMGEWLTITPTDFPREIQVLQALSVGEISEPMDSVFGVELLQRTPSGGRIHYAMEAVVLKFDAAAPEGDEASHSSVRKLAETIEAAVASDPSRLTEFRHTYCCRDTVRFDAGPEWRKVSEALSHLAFGEIIPAPIESASQILIARRVDPDGQGAVDVNFDLAFSGSDAINQLLGRMAPEAARALLLGVGEQAASTLGLDEAARARLVELHEQAGKDVLAATSPEQARLVMEALAAQLMSLLGAEVYPRYQALSDEQIERLVGAQSDRAG